ncbi:MAG: glycosyltransferase family 4 protein [Bacteroidales bacterium]|nr:glycosyltransferase family 4 protein [Candidatus Colimorpha onthohippi]
MIIGYDAKRAFNNKTGLGNYSRMIISGIASAYRDCECVLYTPMIDDELAGYFRGIGNVSSRQPLGLERMFPAWWRSRGLARQVRNDEIDIFHGLSHELPHGLPNDVKKVVTMHDLVAWRYPHFFTKFDARTHQKKQTYACQSADVVIAISEQTKRDLIEIMNVPADRIQVVYQSCDDVFWYPIEEYDKQETRKKYNLPDNYLICVGTIESRKNQLSVIHAMEQVEPDMHLVIVGRKRAAYAETVMAEVKKHPNRIHVIQDADFDDFPYLYACSRGAVYMSHFEGFGIPIIEAMCCGVPVLTSNCSSMPEAGGDAALYADPKNIDEIAAQINRLINDEALRTDLLAKAEIQRNKFTHDKIINNMYNLYCQL